MVANIWVAAADNQTTVVEQHLDSGNFTPNSKDPNGYTAIHAAASYGHRDLLKTLLLRGGDINIQDNEGDTPLHHVEDVETARLMVEQLKADYKITNNEGQTPAEYIEEDDEFPEVVAYLRSLAHDGPTEGSESVLLLLPVPGTIDGHEIRYTMQNEPAEPLSEEDQEERRKKIELILNSENPEEALRELVTTAVREGMAQYQGEQDGEQEKKRQRDA